jgi:hypothetical protein
VKVLAAILTVIALGGSARASPPLALEGVERVERALLPRGAGAVEVKVHALASLVVLDAPDGAPALARAFRMAPLALCPDLEELPSGVALRCRSRRIVAALSRGASGGTVLDVSETRGLPWSGEDGAPLIAFDPRDAGGANTCPGTTPAAQGECLLARGDRATARAILSALVGTAAEGLPSLRLGDLAFAEGDVLAATTAWSGVRGHPWEHVAASRLCELSWSCLAGAHLDAVYSTEGLPSSVARDLRLRKARALAFLGRSARAVETVLDGPDPGATCAPSPALCRDVAATALGDPGPAALEALALWVTIGEQSELAPPYASTLAAAAAAERAGAPLFAANLLAATAGQAPTRALRDHLLRTAELYLQADDRVRAGVIVQFARARAGDEALRGARWAAVTGAVRPQGSAVPDARAPAPTLRPLGVDP